MISEKKKLKFHIIELLYLHNVKFCIIELIVPT